VADAAPLAAPPPTRGAAALALTMSTLAFTICFAAWMLNGVLATFLVDRGVFAWDKSQLGWLIGIPVLTGSLARLPVGVLTDRYGGRVVFAGVMLLSAVPLWLLSYADSFGAYAWASLGFGLVGSSFAVGIAYTSLWFGKNRQGTALGVFGAGNAGAAITSMLAPQLLERLTDGGADLDGWRALPRIYAVVLVGMAVVFGLVARTRIVAGGATTGLRRRLAPLAQVRVWRFGLYYFLVFGGYVALAQWLLPYYVNVYGTSLATAGLLAAIFSLPSGVIRALGGWASDRFGARRAMYWVLGSCVAGFLLLCVPRMEIKSPGGGVMAFRAGTVTEVTPERVVVGGTSYALRPPVASGHSVGGADDDVLVWPKGTTWHDPIVKVGDVVKKKQLLARGTTQVYFQANIWIFTAILFAVGMMMGVGKAAVYKHIPEYFPANVGVVGGIVGVLGGLGGFACPILFGTLLEATGIWTSCWAFFLALSVVCLVWMHSVVRRMIRERAPGVAEHLESAGATAGAAPSWRA